MPSKEFAYLLELINTLSAKVERLESNPNRVQSSEVSDTTQKQIQQLNKRLMYYADVLFITIFLFIVYVVCH